MRHRFPLAAEIAFMSAASIATEDPNQLERLSGVTRRAGRRGQGEDRGTVQHRPIRAEVARCCVIALGERQADLDRPLRDDRRIALEHLGKIHYRDAGRMGDADQEILVRGPVPAVAMI